MAAYNLTNADIYKGNWLMVFLNDKPIAMATSHSLSLSTTTTEVSTKDHGDTPSVTVQSISWEITTENLYTVDGFNDLWTAMKTMQPVTVKFAPASNYSHSGQTGIVGVQGAQNWSPGTAIASGQAVISSLSVNAPSGDNATLSATFTGQGSLDQMSGTQGTQGAQGTQGN